MTDAGAPLYDGGRDVDSGVHDAGSYGDAGCYPVAEVCDGVDNDCNGKADDVSLSCYTGLPARCAYGTSRCEATGSTCQVPSYTEVCNQIDDDCDGLVDEGLVCACDPKAPEDCKNGLDDDCDGFVDGNDPSCQQSCTPMAELCADRIDNDCDGAIDAADSDCTAGCRDQGFENCQDRIDNDCDGLIDGADPQCGALAVGESCENPHGINLSEWNSASLYGRKDDMASSCFPGGADYVFRFDVKSAGTYAVSYQGSEPHAWSIMRGFCSTSGRDLVELVCKDASTPYLDPGTYFLVVEGSPDASQFSVVVEPSK